MIYLDHAATTFPKPQRVIDAVADAMLHLGNAGRGVHDVSLNTSRMIYDTRSRLARLFGAEGPEQVVFTANATESLNIAIQGLFAPGDHVITTAMEHNSVLRPLYYMEERGVRLTILPADAQGNISLRDMEQAVCTDTKAVVCTHASNLTGNCNDLEKIGNICRAHGLLFVVDASQTAGVLPIHMERMQIDVVCFTGHKGLMGPQGTGGLCVRKGVVIRPLLMGGSGVHSYSKTHPSQMPTALEAGTLNAHGIAGLRAALVELEKTGMDHRYRQEQKLMQRFYDGVSAIPGVKIYGDFSSGDVLRAPIVSLNIGDYDSGEMADELAVHYGIMTRAGAHCAPLMHQALGTVEQGAVRFSFSWSNTPEEIDTAVQAVRELAEEDEREEEVEYGK